MCTRDQLDWIKHFSNNKTAQKRLHYKSFKSKKKQNSKYNKKNAVKPSSPTPTVYPRPDVA